MQIPSMSYPKIAEAALMEGPAWIKCIVPYIS